MNFPNDSGSLSRRIPIAFELALYPIPSHPMTRNALNKQTNKQRTSEIYLARSTVVFLRSHNTEFTKHLRWKRHTKNISLHPSFNKTCCTEPCCREPCCTEPCCREPCCTEPCCREPCMFPVNQDPINPFSCSLGPNMENRSYHGKGTS